MLGSLRHPIDKAGLTSLFNSEDVFLVLIYLLKTEAFYRR